MHRFFGNAMSAIVAAGFGLFAGPGRRTGYTAHRRSVRPSSKPSVLGDMGERQRSRRALWERVKREVRPQQRHATFRETWALIR